MTLDHRWNTPEYEERTRQLYRVELHKLYPSEAWALYRILPECKTILDLGCGNGAMAAIARQFHRRDHTTVAYACRATRERLRNDPALRRAADELTQTLTGD